MEHKEKEIKDKNRFSRLKMRLNRSEEEEMCRLETILRRRMMRAHI